MMAAFQIDPPRRRRLNVFNDAFFDEGNLAAAMSCKWAFVPHLTCGDSVEAEAVDTATIVCGMGGCERKFSTHWECESHYQSAHRHRCATCNRVLPTARLLELHVIEQHDLYFRHMAARGDRLIYECLVTGCGTCYVSDVARKRHLVRDHRYPRSFSFHRRPPAIGKQRRRKKATASGSGGAGGASSSGGGLGSDGSNAGGGGDGGSGGRQAASCDFEMVESDGGEQKTQSPVPPAERQDKKTKKKKKKKDPATTPCFYFFKTEKGCVRGDKCPFRHAASAVEDQTGAGTTGTGAAGAGAGAAMSDDEEVCTYVKTAVGASSDHRGAGGSRSAASPAASSGLRGEEQARGGAAAAATTDTSMDEDDGGLAEALASRLHVNVPKNLSFGRRGHGRGLARLARS